MVYIPKILGNARSSLSVQQAAIGVIGNNIANVNTEGYSRRRVETEAIGPGRSGPGAQVGSGVKFSGARPIVDQYVQNQLTTTRGQKEAAAIEDSYLARIERLFSLTGESPTIGSSITEFFSAINDLSSNPTSYELRFNLLERARTLTSTISSTMQSLADMQREADNRLTDEISVVNSITSEVAKLNGLIMTRERSTGGVAADERDQREVLLQKLAEKISFTRSEVNDGSVLIYLEGGLPIVVGVESRELEVTVTPSFGTPAQETAIGGGHLSYIVHDLQTGPIQSHFDLTQTLQNGSGAIGALLRIRGYATPTESAFQANGEIVGVAQRVEALARDLLTSFNTTYLGPDEDAITAGLQYSSLDLDGARPTQPFAFFTFPSAVARDAVADGIPANDDLNTLGFVSYARLIDVAITDPRKIAAARDTNPANGVIGFQPGNSENLRALYDTRNQQRNFSAGTFSRITTYDENYNELLSSVGNTRSASRVNLSVAETNFEIAQNRREQLSGVSLDEEFSQLILYQKAYEASARMIKVAQQLIDEVVNLI
jgi:flagellar hook-associated protein 1 FlgK